MRIRVTGFPKITSKEELKRIFSKFGTVEEIQTDGNKAYIKMPYEYQRRKAIRDLDGTKILGRMIIVEECFL